MKNSVSRTGFVNPIPSQSKLKRLFKYDMKTGHLYWRERINPAIVLGVPIGLKEKNKGKRAMVRIDGVLLYASRVIWKMQTGVDPGSNEIDHKDRDRSNDAWKNLQLLTRKQNLARAIHLVDCICTRCRMIAGESIGAW